MLLSTFGERTGISLQRGARSGTSMAALLGLGMILSTLSAAASSTDPFSWLNEIRSPRALAWVKDQNKRTLKSLQSDPRFERYRQAALNIINSDNQNSQSSQPIRFFTWHGGWLYALLQNAAHPRGMWRRTQASAYLNNAPVWQDLLDIDALAKNEGKPWEMSLGTDICLGSRCLISLVEGGDVSTFVTREFDVESRKFVDGGFAVANREIENVVWKDRDTLLAATVRKPASSLAVKEDEYTVVEWRRGQPLSAAREVFQTKAGENVTDVQIHEYEDEAGNRSLVAVIAKGHDGAQFTYEFWEVGRHQPTRLNIPSAAILRARYDGQWIITFLKDWTSGTRSWMAGSYASIPTAEITRAHPSLRSIIELEPKTVLHGMQVTRDGLLVTLLKDVRAQLWRFTFKQGRWVRDRIAMPDFGTISLQQTEPNASGAMALYEDFLIPKTTYRLDVAGLKATPLTKSTAHFNVDRYVTEQFWAESRDGTRVPYFIVRPKALAYNGTAPTLMHGYGNGGTQIPVYDGILGRLWLDEGGVYILANIRSGNELGPQWNVFKQERQRTYDDFIAVAEDVIRRKVTSPKHLGIHGHSMGGQLVGGALNQRPELFNAGVMENPVLDLIDTGWSINGERLNSAYTAESIALFGSLDVPEERVFLERVSAYQNLKRRDHFPTPLAVTTTTDVVSPDMPRRYCAKLQSLGMPCYFYEYPEGGHSIQVTPEQTAHWSALFYTYFAQRLM